MKLRLLCLLLLGLMFQTGCAYYGGPPRSGYYSNGYIASGYYGPRTWYGGYYQHGGGGRPAHGRGGRSRH